MSISKVKRAAMMNLITKVFDALDPTGRNSEYYTQFLGRMDDKKFEETMRRVMYDNSKGERDYLILQVVDYENDLKMANAEKAAEVLGIPLYEYVVQPYQSSDPTKPYVTKHKCLVGPMLIKRMQQMRIKKNSGSMDTSKRNKYNQVTGADKNGRASDIENFALAIYGAKNISKEFMSARADDPVMKNEFNSAIARDGYVSLDSLTDSVDNKTTLKYVDACFIGMCLKTDLVSDNLMLRYTVEKNKQK